MVLKFGLLWSRLSKTATTSRASTGFLLFADPARLPLDTTFPSRSKPAPAAPSFKNSDDPCAAKPTTSEGVGVAAFPLPSLPFEPRGSSATTVLFSTTFTSNMYRPAFTPTFARHAASKCWNPQSDSGIKRSLPETCITFSVVSHVRKVMGLSAIRGLLSSGASCSCSWFIEASSSAAMAASSSAGAAPSASWSTSSPSAGAAPSASCSASSPSPSPSCAGKSPVSSASSIFCIPSSSAASGPLVPSSSPASAASPCGSPKPPSSPSAPS
mmetsp:Transcript_67826/g.162817  ORF Transcript_67826/g.162817 Transcript_67826/m.162817 type:complete len:270 (+) Transcript_67826:1760-2569(+)